MRLSPAVRPSAPPRPTPLATRPARRRLPPPPRTSEFWYDGEEEEFDGVAADRRAKQVTLLAAPADDDGGDDDAGWTEAARGRLAGRQFDACFHGARVAAAAARVWEGRGGPPFFLKPRRRDALDGDGEGAWAEVAGQNWRVRERVWGEGRRATAPELTSSTQPSNSSRSPIPCPPSAPPPPPPRTHAHR
jgi:hypothetical protein